MKQGKQKEVMEQFEIVLNENHNFVKYEEAKIYYQQLQENKIQEYRDAYYVLEMNASKHELEMEDTLVEISKWVEKRDK